MVDFRSWLALDEGNDFIIIVSCWYRLFPCRQRINPLGRGRCAQHFDLFTKSTMPRNLGWAGTWIHGDYADT
jgi:hypothetical protein